MKFSIVIPAFNEEASIGVAIQSLLNQKIGRKDYEIIVVDNNSTDKTSAVAKAAGADKVLKEKHPGPNYARQKGYSESNGSIVAFLDADSLVPKDWLLRIEKDFKNKGVV